MRGRILLLGALTACGPGRDGEDPGFTVEEFGPEFVDLYCDAFFACDTAGRACPVANGPTGDTCTFDPVAAQTCLDGPYGCDDTITGFEVVLTHEACSRVCAR